MNFINKLLNNLRVASKIRLIIVLASLMIVGFELLSAYNLKENTLVERKEAAQMLVQSIAAQADYIAANNADGKDAEHQIKNLVRATRYSENGYFFISDLDGTMIMNPMDNDLEGKNMLSSSKEYRRSVFYDITQIAKQDGSGFVDYDWPVPGSQELEEKISYVQKINAFPWIIGTGVYFSDVQKEFEEQVTSIAITAGLALFVLISLSALISRNIIRTVTKHYINHDRYSRE